MGHAMQPQEGLISKASAHFLMDHARKLASCQESFGVQVWETLMAKINDAKGKITKGEIVMLRDKLMAGRKGLCLS